jgi:hypothetical protein
MRMKAMLIVSFDTRVLCVMNSYVGDKQ